MQRTCVTCTCTSFQLRPSYWLSILLIREYEDERPKLKVIDFVLLSVVLLMLHISSSPPPSLPPSLPTSDGSPFLQPISPPTDLPPPRWDLVVAAKQLLRQKHHHNASLHPPRPTTAMFTGNPVLQNAGANALSENQIKNADYKYASK